MKRSWLLCIPLRESGALRTHTRTHYPDDFVAKRGPTSEARRRMEVITTMCQKTSKDSSYLTTLEEWCGLRGGGGAFEPPQFASPIYDTPLLLTFSYTPKINRDIIRRLVL